MCYLKAFILVHNEKQPLGHMDCGDSLNLCTVSMQGCGKCDWQKDPGR